MTHYEYEDDFYPVGMLEILDSDTKTILELSFNNQIEWLASESKITNNHIVLKILKEIEEQDLIRSQYHNFSRGHSKFSKSSK